MSDETFDNVLQFRQPSEPEAGNLTCEKCGGEWWRTEGVVIAADGRPTGYALPLTCVSCEDADWKSPLEPANADCTCVHKHLVRLYHDPRDINPACPVHGRTTS